MSELNPGDVTGKFSLGGMKGVGLAAYYIGQVLLLTEQVDLARDYRTINARDHEHWVDTYQSRMQASRIEVFSEARTTFDRFVTPFQYKQSGAALSRGPDAKWQDTMRRTGRYSTGHHIAATQDFAMVRHNAAVVGYNSAVQLSRHKVDVYDDRRHMRRLATLNVGVAGANTAKTGLASAVGALVNSQNQMMSGISSLTSGMVRAGGYKEGAEKGVTAAGE